MNAVTNARNAAAKAVADAETLARIAAHIPGEPKLFFLSSLYGAIAHVVYKVRDIAELQELLQQMPPIECVKYRGTFAGVKPADQYKEKDGACEECDGMTLQVRAGHCIGAYPCDQHPMMAEWYAQAGTDRVHVSVEFHYNTREDWPRIAVFHRKGERKQGARYVEYDTPIIERIELQAAPPHSERIQYGGIDNRTPGSFLVWFRDGESRALALEAMG